MKKLFSLAALLALAVPADARPRPGILGRLRDRIEHRREAGFVGPAMAVRVTATSSVGPAMAVRPANGCPPGGCKLPPKK